MSRFFICFAKNDIIPIQFNAKSLNLVSQIFRKRNLMTFDHVRATFLLLSLKTFWQHWYLRILTLFLKCENNLGQAFKQIYQ